MVGKILAAALLALASTTAQAQDMVQGFEQDDGGWRVFGAPLDARRVPSGTDGVRSSRGAWHAVGLTPATDWGGARTRFPAGGYTTALDLWLDPTADLPGGSGFEYASAINDPSGDLRREFAFVVGFRAADDPRGPGAGAPRLLVGASLGAAAGVERADDPELRPVVVDAPGWYAFTHAFRAGPGGALLVDMTLASASGRVLGRWTRGHPGDVVGRTVGGNRHGWIRRNDMGPLALDEAWASGAPAPCPSLAEAAACAIDSATLSAADLDDADSVVVLHYNAGASPGTADADDVAYVEIRRAQLASSPSLPDPEDHALQALLVAPTSDGSNLPPALPTLDSMTSDAGEPAYGGQAAAWTLDVHDGVNTPGELVGARFHTLLFGAETDGVCELAQLPTAPDALQLDALLRVSDGVLHTLDGPEVELTTALAWDGGGFSLPAPGAQVVLPFLHASLPLELVGQSSDPLLLSGSADPGFVSVWATPDCAQATLAGMASNVLSLGLLDPQVCYTAGDTLSVELRMSCLEQLVSGVFASVDFDPSQLALLPTSAYTTTPFPLHILPIADAGGGTLLLDGSVDFGEPGTLADALLARLDFQVLAGNDGQLASVGFSPGGAFPTELSEAGLPLPTRLGGPAAWTVDETAPVLGCPADIAVVNLPGTCEALVSVTPPSASDDCGVASVVGVRDDGLALDDPYPASCGAASETTITWTATDCAGNTTSCEQLVIVTDTQAPEILGTPADVLVPATAGGCGAVVGWSEPTAFDNCAGALTVTCVPPSGSSFPVGTTSVLCSASDGCGNTATTSFDVTVLPASDVQLEIELIGVNLPASRCIRLVGDDCSQSIEQTLFFDDHDGDDADNDGYVDGTVGSSWLPSTPVRFVGSATLPCGATTALCVKDPQHTTWSSTTLSVVGPAYVGDALVSLDSGDTDDDGDVDLNDVTYLFFKFGTKERLGGCPWNGTRDADYSLNGWHGSEDYAFLVANLGAQTACGCANPAAPGARGPTWVLPASQLPAAQRAAVDLDGDGWVDADDVARLEQRHGLGDALSTALRRAQRADER